MLRIPDGFGGIDDLDTLCPSIDPLGIPRVIDRRQARALGFDDDRVRRRLRSGQWRRLAPGVILTDRTALRADYAKAALLHGGPESVLSGAAGLEQHGFRVRPRRELVLVPFSSGVRSSGRIVVRHTKRLPDPDLAFYDRVAPVERAVADYVRTVAGLDDVRALLAHALQRRLCTVDDLARELHEGQRNGSALFRQALGEVGLGARSAPEARAGSVLRAAGIVDFEQNVEVVARGYRYIVDFLWRVLRKVLEIDSREYHFDERDWGRTLRRHADLETAGYSVIHVRPSELANPDEFTGRIREWLAVHT